MEDSINIKDLFSKSIQEVLDDFRTENIDYQLTYNQYIFVCRIICSMFHKQKIKVVNECVRTCLELENFQCELKLASETKQFGDITKFKICKDSTRLLKEF
ncbi:hypothetical protein EDC94DRAFT_588476 [Helicostylum pulchrum]|nr:hypothetical protein EDC94DRAFT_588476 [Helicostylum pulchrum]